MASLSGMCCEGAAVSVRLHSGCHAPSSGPRPCKVALALSRTSSSFLSGSSNYRLQQRHRSRALMSNQTVGSNVIQAAFIFELIGNFFRYLAATPVKLFAQKVEADLDRAAKMVRTGALLVSRIAKETEEFAEEVEKLAERTEEAAEKVLQVTETIEERIDEVLDVIEGEKKLVITSYNLVSNEGETEIKTTTVAKDGNQVLISVEKSVAN